MSDDWLTEDAFADPEDPAAQERAERRAERERKRREKAEKAGEAPPTPAPQPPAATPPRPKRSPEQEFWDEDPTPPPSPAGEETGAASGGKAAGAAAAGGAAAGGAAPSGSPAPPGDDPEPEGRLARLFGRGRAKQDADPAAEKSAAGGKPGRRRAAEPAAEDATAVHPAGEPSIAERGRPAGNARRVTRDPGEPSPTPQQPAPGLEPQSPTRQQPAPGLEPPSPTSPAPAQGLDAQPRKDERLPPSAAAAAAGAAASASAAGGGGDPADEAPTGGASVASSGSDPAADAPIGGDRRTEPPTAGDRAGAPTGGRRAEPPTADHPVDPPSRDSSSTGEHAADPATRDSSPTGEHAAGPPAADPLREPVPVGADPTRPATGEEPIPDPGAPQLRGQTSEEWAVVPGPRTDDLSDLHEEGNPEMTGAARTGRRSGGDGGRRRGGPLGALMRHPFRIAVVIVLIVILYLLNALFQPFHGDGNGHVAVRIPKGSSVSEVGDILEKRGVLNGPAVGPDASTMFQIRVTLAGKRSDLFAGRFNLQKDMSYGAAIDALSKEPKAAKPGVRTVTVPEGYTRGQAAQIIRQDGVPGNYKKATVKSKFLNPAEYGGKDAKNLEGFLFPDTFELKPKAPVKDLVQLQLRDFKRKIKKVNMKYAKSKNLTVYDVVTIASMIEREAGVAKQRKLVASVIYNRLREGIPLGIDATIRFATGNFERPLTESELETDSPYNTRLNAGLPPGPINSPGLAALNAAAHPAETGFIYYVNDPNSCNELTFAKTEAEFEAAVAKYEKAREANGGNAPSTCGD